MSTPNSAKRPRWPAWLEWLGLAAVSLGLLLVLLRGSQLDWQVENATRLLSELEALERAGKLWAKAEGQEPGTWVSYAQVREHIRPQTRQLVKRNGTDPLGHEWPSFQVGEGYYALPAEASWQALTPAVGEAFWHPRAQPRNQAEQLNREEAQPST